MPESIVIVRITNNPILYDRQKSVLLEVADSGSITRSEYMERTGVSASTASRDLSEMVLAGWLERGGPGVYVAGEELDPSTDLFGFFREKYHDEHPHDHHHDDPDHECGCHPPEKS